MLVDFRPTWRQALACGLCPGVLCALALLLTGVAVPAVAEVLAGRAPYPAVPPYLAWSAAVAAFSFGVAGGLVLRRRAGARVQELGVHCGSSGPEGFAPWRMVVDIRPERRRWRTDVAVYLEDGSTLRLAAPYDGRLLARDPQFERKLFMICNLWETHRDWSRHG